MGRKGVGGVVYQYSPVKSYLSLKNGPRPPCFVCLSSGGRIDHAHHGTSAKKALDETVQFHEAVRVAAELTEEKDTLIVVTSDHAHVMSYSGYPTRGNDILDSLWNISNLAKLVASSSNNTVQPGDPSAAKL
ncbi:unnamed protein product [Timema podura]|uniref:alkaline phosphatase n=1 Tax=Timema podura TaxID=61482 RepID=A0ABN7PL11_TIMPD|nr:unnamed protein product [Timema podura]